MFPESMGRKNGLHWLLNILCKSVQSYYRGSGSVQKCHFDVLVSILFFAIKSNEFRHSFVGVLSKTILRI